MTSQGDVVLRRVIIEADSVEQATAKMRAEVPEGYELLSTEVLAEPRADTVQYSAATTEIAYSKARHKVPKGATVTGEKELSAPRTEILLLDAFDEKTARKQLDERIAEGTKVQGFALESEGSHGFLGFGKKPNRYRAQVFHVASVEVSYVIRAKVSFTLMSGPAAEEARTAVTELIALCAASRNHEDSATARRQIREVGYRLDGTGGFDLMLAAHTLLMRERPDSKRLLDQSWDGIGAWII